MDSPTQPTTTKLPSTTPPPSDSSPKPSLEADSSSPIEETYDFGTDFQTLVLAFLFRDVPFNVRTEGLIKPGYFDSEIHAVLAHMALGYFKTYKTVPSRATLGVMLKDAIAKKQIRSELVADVKEILKSAFEEKLADVDSTIETCTRFARKQELTKAILQCAELIDKGDYDSVEPIINKAVLVGANDGVQEYDFFKESENRHHYREEVEMGRILPTGITTGFKEFDNHLYHKGWGREELSVIMGPAKSGKTMALLSFGVKAVLSGYNVLYCSLEVSRRILADRIDANIAGVKINELVGKKRQVKDAATLASPKAGVLKIHDYPTGTFTPLQLRRLLARYAAMGVRFDMVVVDYADIMAPDKHSDTPRENSRLIYIGLRAIAQEFNCAVLSATQTNREGFKAAVGKMEHVSDDINKARTVDLLIAINADEDDRRAHRAKLHIIASRNQDNGEPIKVKTNLAMARFLESLEFEKV